MSLTHWHGKLHARDRGAPRAHACGVAMTSGIERHRRVDRRHLRGAHAACARLVRNPDESSGGPKYALADQSGNDPTLSSSRCPGIDLEPYVGYAVKVRHDTGRTLLASQLELPGQEQESILDGASDGEARPTPASNRCSAAFSMRHGHNGDAASTTRCGEPAPSPVQPAQYVQGPAAPVVIQERPCHADATAMDAADDGAAGRGHVRSGRSEHAWRRSMGA